MTITAKIIAESIYPGTNAILTTFALRYPRFIHPSFLTHRVFSRGGSSSRAVPVARTIAELAEREGIAPSYMTRVLRLTLLAPDIVEAILDGKQGSEVTLARVLEPFAEEWGAQPVHFGPIS